MTIDEAIKILDPETSREALEPYRLDCALRFAKVEEACRLAARELTDMEALRSQNQQLRESVALITRETAEKLERLAAYEATGLSPEDTRAGFTVEAVLKLCGQALRVSPERLRELAEADRDGRALVLPCKVGDTVYEVQPTRKRAQPLEIISVQIGRTGGSFFYWELKDGLGIYQNARGFDLSQLGKTVFLTREEADTALEEADNV